MNREIPVASRVVHQRDTHRNNCILTDKIMRMKFANFSALQGQSEYQNRKRPIKMDIIRLNSLQPRRVRSVLKDQQIRSQNKMMLNRLVKQRSTLSNKIFAQQRYRNIQFLKRIGRYPYKNTEGVQLQENKCQLGINRRHTLGDINQEDSNSQINVVFSNISSEEAHHDNLIQILKEESKKQHMIILWTKVIQLGKCWYTIRYIRLKNHYQIELISYPTSKIRYSLKLGEKEGTSMLTDFDYDYAHISSHCLKMSELCLNLSFQLKNGKKKKYCYRFEKKDLPPISQKQTSKLQRLKTEFQARKTMFAIENEFNEKKQNKLAQIKRNRNSEKPSEQPNNLLEDISSTDICLQRIQK